MLASLSAFTALPRPAALPNGLHVYEHVKGSAVITYEQVLEYFDARLSLPAGATVVDVGANIGVFGLEVLRRCEGRLRLVAVEPVPELFKRMDRGLKEQFPTADIRTIQAAVSAAPGDATLYYRPFMSSMSSLDPQLLLTDNDIHQLAARSAAGDLAPSYRERLPWWLKFLPRRAAAALLRWALRLTTGRTRPRPCRVTTVAEIVREHKLDVIDLLKVDVEGAEWDVLMGVGEAWPRVRAVTVELHDIDGRLEKVRQLLIDKGLVDLRVTQEPAFRGTSVYGVIASR